MIPKPSRRNRWTHSHYQRVFEECVVRGFMNQKRGIHRIQDQVLGIWVRLKEGVSRVG